MEEEFMGHRLRLVYRDMELSMQNEIIALWTDSGVLTLGEAKRRVQEVVCIILNPEDRPVGVSTAYLQKFMAEEHPFYFMRLFIRPEYRGHIGLYRLISRRTRQYLKTFIQPDCIPKGVMIIIENQKFMQKGNRKSLEKRGWTYYGQGPKGNHVWYECFDGSLLNKSEPQ